MIWPYVTIRRSGHAIVTQNHRSLAPQGVYGHAKNKWLKSLKILGQLFDVETDEEMAEAAAIKASCMVNLALCAQREDQFSEALSWCTKALRYY